MSVFDAKTMIPAYILGQAIAGQGLTDEIDIATRLTAIGMFFYLILVEKKSQEKRNDDIMDIIKKLLENKKD